MTSCMDFDQKILSYRTEPIKQKMDILDMEKSAQAIQVNFQIVSDWIHEGLK